jgi:hypothetical protein
VKTKLLKQLCIRVIFNSLINMQKLLTGLASLTLAVGSVEPAIAAVLVRDPTAGPLSIFDQSDLLNYSLNGGFYMEGLEVAPDGSGVFVTQANTLPVNIPPRPGEEGILRATLKRLIKSTGSGTASQIGPTLQAGNFSLWGNDLTLGPEGRYYAVTESGIWGFDPAGGPATQFSGGQQDILTASGLTFSPDGSEALFSSDYPYGLWRIPKNGTFASMEQILGFNDLGGGFDDHVITKNGKVILMGDGTRKLWEVLPDRSRRIVYDLKTDPNVSPFVNNSASGSRGAVDPITGDIFYGLTFFYSGPFSIIRIKSDFSSASVFATGFAEDLRDFDFGRSSSGSPDSISLYVSENNRATGVGTIYEIPVGTTAVPEASDTILGSIMVLGFGVLFKIKLSKKRNLNRKT